MYKCGTVVMYRGDFSQTYMGGGNTHTETKLDSLQQFNEYRTAQFQNRIPKSTAIVPRVLKKVCERRSHACVHREHSMHAIKRTLILASFPGKN